MGHRGELQRGRGRRWSVLSSGSVACALAVASKSTDVCGEYGNEVQRSGRPRGVLV